MENEIREKCSHSLIIIVFPKILSAILQSSSGFKCVTFSFFLWWGLYVGCKLEFLNINYKLHHNYMKTTLSLRFCPDSEMLKEPNPSVVLEDQMVVLLQVYIRCFNEFGGKFSFLLKIIRDETIRSPLSRHCSETVKLHWAQYQICLNIGKNYDN